jgi:NADH-quinone oxidoreductase subunit C
VTEQTADAAPALATEVARALGGQDIRANADGAGAACVDVPVARWQEAARYLRNTAGLDFFDWLSAVDEPDGDPAGVDVVLHVSDSAEPSRRLLLRTRLGESDLTLPSLTGVWAGAAWHERETYEMFGVDFSEYTDANGGSLRSLLLPEEFQGNPLRKSFVLASRVVRPWPGGVEPGDSHGGAASKRKAVLPPGVPEPEVWGPRDPAPPEAPPHAPAERTTAEESENS